MSRIKLFEEYHSEEPNGGFISVPSDFQDRLKGFGELVKQRSEYYAVPINQIKIDLFYGIKTEIRDFLSDVEQGIKRTKEEYHNRLDSEIDGILYKFSGGKYTNILKDDVPLIKDMLWNLIDDKIPYDEVDYYYTYDLQGKLLNLLDEFLSELVDKDLFKEIT